jgi:glycogen debranching enzyme
MSNSAYLNLLRNHIDISRVPFSDRGSRLLIYQEGDQSKLMVKLAERLTELQPGVTAYLERPPFIRDLCLIDEAGQPLSFEIETTPHMLRFKTRMGNFNLVFQDIRTMAIGLPSGVTAGVRFRVSPQFWQETEQGGLFKSVRSLGYASNGQVVHNRIVPDQGGYTVEFVTQADMDGAIILNVSRTQDLHQQVLPFAISQAAAEARWQNWFNRVPSVAEPYRQTYAYAWWIMGNNLISPLGHVAYEAMIPSKMSYVGLWLWDSAMHALAYRHLDPDLARNQIRSMLAHQLPDGMLPDAIYDEGVVATMEYPVIAEVTKPPIVAWAALKLHETDPNLEFLQEIYVPLVRWNAWWFAMNDDDVDGLVQYNHPYSSGLDDNPLWDYGMPVESPELNTYLCVQMGSLARMAELLGMPAEGAMWRRRAQAIVRRMIADMWDEETGIFRALQDEKPIPVITPFNLYPLWTGQLPDPIRERLIAHLTDRAEFWGDYPIPSVARNDPHFNAEKMWRGPVWANINYFFVEALHQVGEHELARSLRDKTLNLIMKHPSIYEYYNAITGEPPATAADTFGWSAAVFIDLAIQASHPAFEKRIE